MRASILLAFRAGISHPVACPLPPLMSTIDPAALDLPIAGHNLRGVTLRAHLDRTATLLVFLRHLA